MKKSLFLLLSLAVLAPAAAAESIRESEAQCKMAEETMLTMMSESESVWSDPVAHELLGDVYAAKGLSFKATREYEFARVLAKRRTAEGEVATKAGCAGTERISSTQSFRAIESSTATELCGETARRGENP